MPHVAPYHFATTTAGDGAIGCLRRPRVSVGIVNNMPDAALQATERQFVTLLQSAAEPCDIRIHLFTLPGIWRGEAARERVRSSYLDYAVLAELRLDALIVTGALPAAAAMTAEECWPQFTELVDWARANTISSIWSCFAAHAAVFHLDGIERRPLARKLSGVFAIDAPGDHPLMAGLGPRYRTPHSRYNEVVEGDLVAAGYDVLGRSGSAGVDMFAKDAPSRFLFLQGHPEYDGDTLMREYRRDIGRFLCGERPAPPAMPEDYFPPPLAAAVSALTDRAIAERNPGLLNDYLDLQAAALTVGDWAPAAVRFFRNWISGIAGTIAGRAGRPGVAA